jgi:hypothetical protein
LPAEDTEGLPPEAEDARGPEDASFGRFIHTTTPPIESTSTAAAATIMTLRDEEPVPRID